MGVDLAAARLGRTLGVPGPAGRWLGHGSDRLAGRDRRDDATGHLGRPCVARHRPVDHPARSPRSGRCRRATARPGERRRSGTASAGRMAGVLRAARRVDLAVRRRLHRSGQLLPRGWRPRPAGVRSSRPHRRVRGHEPDPSDGPGDHRIGRGGRAPWAGLDRHLRSGRGARHPAREPPRGPVVACPRPGRRRAGGELVAGLPAVSAERSRSLDPEDDLGRKPASGLRVGRVGRSRDDRDRPGPPERGLARHLRGLDPPGPAWAWRSQQRC